MKTLSVQPSKSNVFFIFKTVCEIKVYLIGFLIFFSLLTLGWENLSLLPYAHLFPLLFFTIQFHSHTYIFTINCMFLSINFEFLIGIILFIITFHTDFSVHLQNRALLKQKTITLSGFF